MTLPNKQVIIFTLLLMIIILSGISCKSQKIEGNWTDTKIRIDGKIDDWQDIPVMYFEDEGAAVSFCNDSNWLYIQFRTKDPQWVKTIKMTGITLYFDTKGKKSKDFFIKYKGGPSMKDLMKSMGKGYIDNNMSSQMNNRMAQMAGDETPQLTCYIKDKIIEKLIHPDGSEGPSAMFDTSFGFYCYEFRLPLEKSTLRYYGLGIEPGNPISIGAVWGDMGDMKGSRPIMSGMGGSFDGMSGRGGKMGGGGRGGGMRGGGNRQNMQSKQEVWISTQIIKPDYESNTE